MSERLINRFADPVTVFLSVYTVFIFMPLSIMYGSDYYSDRWISHSVATYQNAVGLALITNFLFVLMFTVGVFLVKFKGGENIGSRNNRAIRRYTGKAITNIEDRQRKRLRYYSASKHKSIFYLAIFCSCMIWLNFAFGGYEKIALFGKDVGMMEYRQLGLEDRGRLATIVVQMTRRLLLPFCIIYFWFASSLSNHYSKKFLYFLFLSFLVSILTTLDRGPAMMLIVLVGYLYFCTTEKVSRIVYLVLGMVGILILVSGLLTYVQHNLQDYNSNDVYLTGLIFLQNRVFMAPNFVPVELSFALFDIESTKLWLKYSRLTALFTGNYVGTGTYVSVYVSPVGAVADIWRNMGFVGIVGFGFITGIFFQYLSDKVKRIDQIAQVCVSFTVISLVFYFIFGVFFSQGILAQVIFLIFIAKYFTSKAVSK